MPIDKPSAKNRNTIHLSARLRSCRLLPARSFSCSHFKIAQKANPVKKEESAYTSPSTALNQKESEKVYAKAPTTPAPITVYVCKRFGSSWDPIKSLSLIHISEPTRQ